MRRIPAWIGLVLSLGCVLGWTLGCGGSDDAPPSPGAGPAAAPGTAGSREGPSEVEKVASMELHYGVAILGHDALIHGDLPTFRAALIEVSQQELPPGSDPSWQALQDRLQEAAAVAARAEDLKEAATRMGGVVRACGTCHASLGIKAIYPAPSPREGDDPVETAMLEHQWVTERLWEGVTGPWDVAWERGASALADMRIVGEVDSFVPSDAVQKQEDALRALGDDALAARTLDERAAVYGRALATCGACHQAFGVRFQGR